MQAYEVHGQVKLLLVQQSNEKERIMYTADGGASIQVPKIGTRPPYYCNPRYGWVYPVI
ncbi:hypothetical protein RRU94_24065 [Domibacillus sp. DTU_2020_1001157_1_SI_ALB_TIR_016]|uniref:hypothetical protein n=1 Tax=Domibacillus sp. DTU_2020_1001157_1_SI_ALB_TIR_016 TaxID=3077789 RepID=UPI0028EF38DC|nr:hypothetical protein [Domibacillus sp. DTU_2020_1001157_1_SI_ALB_TIR_016]WNS80532.1 hypothetical protein RRU94_24065 [Domibacillus sp. DTU_2020_1001157_1_SI_ALB_TIR_016]